MTTWSSCFASQPAISVVDVAADATEALRRLQDEHYDGDVPRHPHAGLDGLELARLLLQFTDPPLVIFVTAYESHAVAAFQAHARGYLLKPVSADRLSDAVAQIAEAKRPRPAAPTTTDGSRTSDDLLVVPVDVNGRTLMVERADVCWIQANGDYVRLHTVQRRRAFGAPAARTIRRALGRSRVCSHPPQLPHRACGTWSRSAPAQRELPSSGSPAKTSP